MRTNRFLPVFLLLTFIFFSCAPDPRQPRIIYVDEMTPPVLTVNSITNGMEVGSYFTVSGTAYDADSGLSNVFVRTDNGSYVPASVSGSNWSLVISNLSVGVHTNSVYAQDKAGNSSATASVWINRAVIPWVAISWPTNGSVYNTANPKIYGTAGIDGPQTITSVLIKVNNGSYTAADGLDNWTNIDPLNNGTNYITVIAIGNNNKTNVPVTVNFYSDTANASTNGDNWTPGSGWVLVWQDEFNGSSINTSNWTHVNMKWPHNAEMEYYTPRLYNSWTSDGHLVIKAIKESYLGASYTSARIDTKGKISAKYGKIAARMQMPYGTNQWPAFWLLGTNDSVVGWPACGEIDIMEYRGDIINKSSSAVHGPSYSGGGCYSGSLQNSDNLTNSFHVYEVIWTATNMQFYRDGNHIMTLLKSTVTGSGKTWVFDLPFYVIINLAVGSTNTPYTGYLPVQDSVFPTHMFVDWVRVYTN